MRAVVQRVEKSSVTVDGSIAGEIGKGLTVLLGVGQEDSDRDIDYLADKIINLRIFEDNNGKMNLSLLEVGGELLVVSQFTLYGDCRKGRRPGYDRAARPEAAKALYEGFVEKCRGFGVKVQTGIFQAEMLVDISNDGPVTLLLDSKREF
ncbi:D-aminoacyl-tRNA deacylase [Ruminiclostridium cellobioparum]|jgi:D-aminoacyl-tRNA deacylase|uniref:D-aminoacyl-tRNA deacylase n=1 Tax=Ruminiclostridium cellobioparum subsp. termitidis CT1112 TaxID=1195236 RepID=S0FXM4_RUMCE|nr:D-aminoacyl-tRNA deacylase [Ruminiclostridium cellobioparum]EMS73864.1 D-tyrosyl-tRNA(Tyr) deacylase [Ruminiclostridium cellobioparum subsp. termitidis CT1112]